MKNFADRGGCYPPSSPEDKFKKLDNQCFGRTGKNAFELRDFQENFC